MTAKSVLTELAITARNVAVPFYWLDVNHIWLGANDLTLAEIGVKSQADVIGKTCYDLYPHTFAHEILSHHKEVMLKGTTLTFEETIKNRITGAVQYYTATIWPLRDDSGEIIGTAGISTDITREKITVEYLNYERVLNHLKMVAELLPISVYWFDTSQKFIGANSPTLRNIGAQFSKDELFKKTPLDIYPETMARNIMRHHSEVVRSGQPFFGEEAIEDITTREVKYFKAVIAPLYDDDGRIIGTIGASLDITAEKEAQQLRLEFETQQVFAQEQEKFRASVDQVAHDIRSPLTTLSILTKVCDGIPEKQRIAIREAAVRINDIANNLLHDYKKLVQPASVADVPETLLVAPLLLELLTEKKYQYADLPIKFDTAFVHGSEFSWILIQPGAFGRMLSNLINNSVDALESREGNISLCLYTDNNEVHIKVMDDGKGMSPEVRQKILDQLVVTQGKADGHGLEMTQVRETLKHNHGKLDIRSRPDAGAEITLSFPLAPALDWIADSVELFDHDTVVILDDDSSIQHAWDLRLEKICKVYPQLTIKHLELGREAIDFISGLSPEQKQQVFLLADYELLKQNLTGLDVIQQTEMQRAILVTSHYANKRVQQQARAAGIKVLPKQLATEVAVNVCALNDGGSQDDVLLNTEIVFVDDDQDLLDGFRMLTYGKQVDFYHKPNEFLAKAHRYSRQAKIMLDQHFAWDALKGTQIAEQLHALGFESLFLLSGDNIHQTAIPDYLTFIMKGDMESLMAVLEEQTNI